MWKPKSIHRLAIFVVLSSACSDQTTVPRMAAPNSVLEGRGVATAVSLVVTVANTDSLGNPYGFQSDGQGTYSDGLQGVQAALDQYGTFAFNTQPLTGTKNRIRWVKYNFDDPVDPSNTYRPNPSTTENYHFSTGPSDFQPFIPIQNLGVNGNPVSECIYMGNSVANSTTQWRVSFHKGLEHVANSQSAYAVVTRQSVSPGVWTITPTGACSPVSNTAAVRSGDATIFYGFYRIPFYFTLRAK
jgi:hypothetical protein